MAFTPENASTTQILALSGDTPTVAVRHRDLPLRIQVDPDVKVVDLTHALASHGLCLRFNHESGMLWLTKGGE